ncbi:impB/mucB/samB family protein [Immersiella caudata]|uniref:DNA polymerase eta n=1 Tax=Immersiella caudata TaxID=314043 RepID=A0AA39XHH0_9PEZI|nr:impB/mucB/samB family protein [Immersiella caudata]
MSSPPRFFRDSSPAGAPGRKRSQFTYRHFAQMASYSTTCPLRVIAHIDLDAFYAQCEMVRLGIPEDKPLAVQQWQGLIAINYSARSFGIGRHCTVTEAKKMCPDLIAQHVATWREGDEKWAYRPDAADHVGTDKVSLDPYRLESRKILAVIKDHLPSNLQKVEKASIDEVFIDLSAQVHKILLERFPEELANLPPYDDPAEQLPMPSVSALDWKADALVDLDDEHAEFTDPDWDDVAILIGSEIVRDIRAVIKEKLHYTCSGGVARNKLLSKLGSAYKKPNQQTIVRNRAIHKFLSGFKFTKIRNLGGKLGEEVSRAFNTEEVSELLAAPVEQLKLKLGDDTGTWVFNTVRGVDNSEVNSRTQIKSMLSAKSFRPSINTSEQATKWLRIFAADIFSRLVEEGVLENKRRPRTINLHFRHGTQTRSRQSPIPQGRLLEEETMFDLAKILLGQIIAHEGQVWPCSNISLSVAGFEDGITRNMGIGAFLLKGDEAQALKESARMTTEADVSRVRPAEKRRRTDGGIQRFFAKETSRTLSKGLGSDSAAMGLGSPAKGGVPDAPERPDEVYQDHAGTPIAVHVCSRCNISLDGPEALQSHEDWHFAKTLQDEERERVNLTLASREATAASSSRTAAAPPRRPGRPKKTERGQSKLNFG